MDSLRALLLGSVLLFLHPSADASTLREMFITDSSEEEVKTEQALVPAEDDNAVIDLLDLEIEPADFSFDEIPSDDIEQTSENDLNENDVGMYLVLLFRQFLSSNGSNVCPQSML